MIKIKTLSARNFLSIGNATQALKLDRSDLTLVLGENLDLGGNGAGSRNAAGKSSILNALSYALYGQAITSIRKDNLINKSNGKNMLVTVEFDVDGVSFRIERGRRPNVMKYYIGDIEQAIKDGDNNAQGENRETQQELERMLGMSHDMFKHIVALNTYTEPFLAMRANDQRIIIEQLLGITLLSERAEKLKESTKETRDLIVTEEFRIKAVQDANKKIGVQIAALRQRQTTWESTRYKDCEKYVLAIHKLEHVDISNEVIAHRNYAEYTLALSARNTLVGQLSSSSRLIDSKKNALTKLESDLIEINLHKCYACGNELHNAKQAEFRSTKSKELSELTEQITTLVVHHGEMAAELQNMPELPNKPITYYTTLEEALNHQHRLATLQTDLESRAVDVDPYAEQILDMCQVAIEEISFTAMETLIIKRDHQEFLLKLLTNKDSFVRKRIIDQNLTYLNARLGSYLDQIGLPHKVVFQNDLSVTIEELGRELDYYNLSRGEMNRLVLSLSLAFRDVWESLYKPINLLFIDEMIDSGMDFAGVENALATLKTMSRGPNKSIWLISHRDELVGRVNNVLRVIKENGFTHFETDTSDVG